MRVLDKLQLATRVGRDLTAELRAALTEGQRHRPRPPVAGLVVDVGAGQAPEPRADVVVEKYVVDSFERAGEQSLQLDRPLVVADAEAMPFRDASFAYVVASHVLEHATDPVRLAGELQRVGSAGFVQVPSAASERVYGWPYHPWLIDLEADGTLVFRSKEFPAPTGGDVMHTAHDESVLLRLGWAAHRSRWHHSIHWATGGLKVRVEGERVYHQRASVDPDRTADAVARAGADGRVPPLPERLRQLLVCPYDRTSLTFEGESIRCTGCGRCYAAPSGVPVLLKV